MRGLCLCGSLRFAATNPGQGLRQPSTVNGSPETLVERGVEVAADALTRWLEEMEWAADTDDTFSFEIAARLWIAAQSFDLTPIVEVVHEELVRGAMLGALDAHWEADQELVVAPAEFAGLSIGPSGGVKDFVAKPFAAAVADFKDRAVMTRDAFDLLDAEARRRAFTVAGLLRNDVLNTAHDELTKAIQAGSDLRTFRKALNRRFREAGYTTLEPSHLETVFRTNVMTAYGNGRTQQMRQPSVLAARPYWQIFGVRDDRVRATHKAAHGKVLSAFDPFWQTVGAPPWGYNCRCRVVSRSESDVRRMGLTVILGSELSGLPDAGFQTQKLPPPPRAAEPVPEPQPVQRAGFDERELRKRGIGVNERVEEVAERVFAGSAADIDALTSAWSAPGVKAKIVRVVATPENEISAAAILEDERGLRVGHMKRSFFRDGGKLSVRHELFELEEERQGDGIGAAILKTSFQEYERLGVTSVSLDASWTGRYVWPRFGFRWDATTAAAMRLRLEAFLIREGIAAERAAALAAATSINAGAVAELEVNGRKLGKEFLLDAETPGFAARLRVDPADPGYAAAKKRLGF